MQPRSPHLQGLPGAVQEPSPEPSTSYESVSEPSSSDQDSLATSWQSGQLDEGDQEQQAQPYNFDRAATSRHAYLGDNLEDLVSSQQPLSAGASYRVPLFPLEGVVLCPGDTLPLKLQHPADQALAQRAVQAVPPVTGLIAVACLMRLSGWRHGIPPVGCLAEIKQLRLQEDGSLCMVCKGRQRAAVLRESALLEMARVKPLPDPPPQRVPREVAHMAAAWPPWAYRPFDVYRMAGQARELLAAVAPSVPAFHGDPLALSYFLLSNLPLDDSIRQQLLEADSAVDRLRTEVRLLREMGKVRCRRCRSQIGDLRDVVQMSEEGVSGCYVNPHGVVHDIFMLGKVHGMTLEGSPQTESSWFPGYAWTVAYCRTCWHHLGWHFTAVSAGLQPASFWGLRRSAIQGATLRSEAISEEGVEEDIEGNEEWSEGTEAGEPEALQLLEGEEG